MSLAGWLGSLNSQKAGLLCDLFSGRTIHVEYNSRIEKWPFILGKIRKRSSIPSYCLLARRLLKPNQT
jgi:hypothetical protein